jgi:Xaa-Pro dipeptidase
MGMGRAFTEAEHRARIEKARKAMAQAGVDAVVAVAPEHLYYFSGYDAHTQFSPQAFIFGKSGEPTLVIRDVDGANAEESSWAKDVRTYHHGHTDPAKLIADTAKEHAKGGTIGMGLGTYALPGALALRILDALAGARPKDVSSLIEYVRRVKSPAEMAYIREAARYAELGLLRVREAARPGVSEIELAGEIEAAMRQAGTEYSAMPTWFSSGPRTRGSHKTPTARRVQAGEPVRMEFAGVHRRYHAVTMQTFWVGEPKSKDREAYAGALAALKAGCAAVKSGAPVAQSEMAAFDEFKRRGTDVRLHARFGYGVSAAYPPTWLEGFDITMECPDSFEANTAFVLHTLAVTPEGNGLLLGGAYVLTESGLECWSGGDLGLMIV